MQKLSKKKMQELNSQGFIPGPSEDLKKFLYRIDQVSTSNPESIHPKLTNSIPITKILKTIKPLDFLPENIKVIFSKYQLPPWQAAATWIIEKQGQCIALFIQMHPKFFHQETLFGLYQRDEILKHEAVHALRAAFHEPYFEELLAYRTATTSFRRYFGPIFASSKETTFLVIALFLSVALSLLSSIFMLIPFCLLSYFLLRTIKKQLIYQKAYKEAEKALKDPYQAENLLLRLTDQEMIALSQKGHDVLQNLYQQMTLRVAFLKELYPINISFSEKISQ